MNNIFTHASFNLNPNSIHIISAAFMSLFILFGTWYLNKFLKKVITQLEKNHTVEPTLIKILQNLSAIIVYSLGTILILENLHIKLSSLLGTVGVLTVGISLALQETLTNIAAGILLLWDKPFKIGDYIISTNDPKFEGKVIDINLRTTILNYNGDSIVIPNHTLYKIVMTVKNK